MPEHGLVGGLLLAARHQDFDGTDADPRHPTELEAAATVKGSGPDEAAIAQFQHARPREERRLAGESALSPDCHIDGRALARCMRARNTFRVPENSGHGARQVCGDQGLQQGSCVRVAARAWIVLGIGKHQRTAGR